MNKFACMVVFCAFSAAMLQGALAAVYVVGDAAGWTIPQNRDAYSKWASGKTFRVGDILVFNFVTNAHDVLQVPKASYDGCSSDNAIGSMITTGPANVTLNSTGDHYYICTISGHCNAGQKLAISVSTASGTPGANPPTTSPAPITPTVYVVGDAAGWTVPQNRDAYSKWASGKTFRVGDILVFNFVTNAHDVLQVPKASYDGCSQNNAIGSTITTGPANVTLKSTGDHYYICTISGHCNAGQKLAISVSTASGTPGAKPPTTSPAPTTPTTPSPTSSEVCPPTPSPAPKADGPGAATPTAPKAEGPGAATPTAPTTPPPPPSSSNSLFASLGIAAASIAVGLFA